MRPDSSPTLHAYPALLVAVCLASGIGLAAAWTIPLWAWGSLALAGLAAAGLGAWRSRDRLVHLQPLVRALSAGVVVLALGGVRYGIDHRLPAHHVAHLIEGDQATGSVSLTGRVVKGPVVMDFGTRLVLDGLMLRAADGAAVPRAGRVQATLAAPSWKPAPAFPPVAPGDVLQITASLKPLPARRNPADFDYAAYLRRQGIHAVLIVDRADQLHVVGQRLSPVERLTVRARRQVRDRLARYLPQPDTRALLAALLLGDRTGIDDDTRSHFARTGLLHLLAISGLHVMLIGLVLYHLLRPTLLRCGLGWRAAEVTRAVVTMAVLLAYLLLAGAGPSVVRAVVMAGLWIGAVLVQRPTRALNLLGVAGVVLMLARPATIFDVGFQLSFAAVAALITLPPVLMQAVPEAFRASRLPRNVTGMMVASLAATIGTMPVLLHHFGYASFAGLILNLAAIPLTAVTLGAGLLTVLTPGWLAETFGALTGLSVELLTATAEVGAGLFTWTVVEGRLSSAWMLGAFVLILGALAQWPRPRLRWRLIVGAVLLVTSGVWIDLGRGTHRADLEVVFFDVGQGDAALIALPNRRHLLIDTGVGGAYTDRGARTVRAHLDRFGIRRLDAVVVTHPHSDHLGGLPSLLRHVDIGTVYHGGEGTATDLHTEAIHLLDSLRIPDRIVQAGMTIDLDPSVRIQVLSPTPRLVGLGEANEGSVVLRMQYGKTTMLFAGDAETEAERHLVSRYGPLLPSDLIKVAHHGSPTSSTLDFVQHVTRGTAPLAVVSVGRTNRYGLPSPAVVERWRSSGAAVHTTGVEGAVWVRSNGSQVTTVPWH